MTAMTGQQPSPGAAAPPALHAAALNPLIGLVGIFIAAMMAGLNARVSSLALADLRGDFGVGLDQASWLTTVYSAGELIAMPFAAWFAITLSLRRFHLAMLTSFTAIALVLPFVHEFHLLLVLRALQGLVGGAMVPVLMMAALRFLPATIRLYGLSLFAMTATFSPNMGLFLTGHWIDRVSELRLVYWQTIPLAPLVGLLVYWAIPQDPINLGRFRQANWLGMALGIPALGLLTVALDQGVRLDWFNSPLVTAALFSGLVLFIAYVMTEWFHPAPFVKPQILFTDTHIALGITSLVLVLILFLSASLPATFLSQVAGYKALQSAQIGLIVGLPQLVLGPLTAFFLYKTWVDARIVFSIGLCFIALACVSGSYVTSSWVRDQFQTIQVCHAIGQAMTVVPLLFLVTSVVKPMDGPYISGAINIVRVLSTVIGGALLAQFQAVRNQFHSHMIIDRAGSLGSTTMQMDAADFAAVIKTQATVLTTADAYRAFAILALLLIPIVLSMKRIRAIGASAPVAPMAQKGP